nr:MULTISPECIES: CPBP family intramembrane glutamic endopeptidase [Myxococcaceae]
MRAVGILLFAPAAEELLFRGLLFGQLERTRLGTAGALVVSAALFAVLHLQYAPLSMALIFLDGLVLGAARAQARSVLLCFLMHALGNAVALAERWPAG